MEAITTRTFSPPPPKLKKWCDRWNKAARKAGVDKVNMAARVVSRPNGLKPVLHLSLVRIGQPAVVHSFKGLADMEITDEMLWKATDELTVAAEIKTKVKIQ